MYDDLLVSQMTNLKETEAMVKKEIRLLTQKLEKIWAMQDDILKAVKTQVDKEEAEGK